MALDRDQYKDVFDLHYEALYGYACSILKEEIYVGDLVQNVFLKLWQGRDSIKAETVKSYLYTSVRNECLNYLKHKGVQATHAQTTKSISSAAAHHNPSEQKELHEQIQGLLAQLPERCATVFYLCRQTGLSYKEVAETMDISVKTVENQMSKALKFLRTGLASYFVSTIPLFILYLVNLYYYGA